MKLTYGSCLWAYVRMMAQAHSKDSISAIHPISKKLLGAQVGTNQMPSLKMKTKLATSSSKEKNGLHVCPNSSVISKSSLSRTRSVQNAEEVADLIHNTRDVPIYYKVYPHQVGRNGDHANDLVDELLEKQQPPVTDSANLDTMYDMVPTRWSNILRIHFMSPETLVHSTLEHCDDADFTFPVFFNMKEHIVYVKQRPHLRTFLERVAEMFEIVIFTASQSIYAKHLLDILDPDGKLISRRAYRESCIFSDGSYTKDLTVLGVDLTKVVIVDNSPQVFRLQVNNGIPIKSWFDDPSDSALISLLPFLETLADADDVRPVIAKKFGNKE
ncbi:hypothetical protein RND71_033660 [Anisodus tanguticus]|uniref:FCP1 homology domain-containing protein n=1 Tax=Anisodus tanguticus TaxID=243964 RepID=A0AAE1V1M9_9SOLA|nr:hypothetical protein RND71_033660 [Anisodus tanguticus]